MRLQAANELPNSRRRDAEILRGSAYECAVAVALAISLDDHHSAAVAAARALIAGPTNQGSLAPSMRERELPTTIRRPPPPPRPLPSPSPKTMQQQHGSQATTPLQHGRRHATTCIYCAPARRGLASHCGGAPCPSIARTPCDNNHHPRCIALTLHYE